MDAKIAERETSFKRAAYPGDAKQVRIETAVDVRKQQRDSMMGQKRAEAGAAMTPVVAIDSDEDLAAVNDHFEEARRRLVDDAAVSVEQKDQLFQVDTSQAVPSAACP